MTTWADQLTRIRRWIRDPDANIFNEAFLRRLYNDELNSIYAKLGVVCEVKAVRVHPEFQYGYLYDWEFVYLGSAEVYKAGDYYDTEDYSYQHIWEPESLKGYDATTYAAGTFYTHPWEAWMADTPYHPPPIPLPSDWSETVFMAFDRAEIQPLSKKDIIGINDHTWKTVTGSTQYYWRDSKFNNWVYIYPLPTMTWQDDEITSGDPDTAEYTTIDTGITFGPEDLYFGSTLLTFGTTDDALDTDNNLVVIYRVQPVEIDSLGAEPELPDWVLKYVEYGVAERALRSNTDGRIESLADYWGIRKKAGHEVIDRFKRMQMTNRNIGLKSQKICTEGDRPKYPRLPSTYPDYWS